MTLRILSLNVQGFRSPAKQVEVVQFARSIQCDLFLLQETHFSRYSDVVQFTERCNVRAFFSFGTTNQCGVGVVVLNRALLPHCSVRHDTEGRALLFDLFVGRKRIRLVNIYAPARASCANAFFQDLDASFIPSSDVILCGDFNCVLDSDRDVRGPGRGRPTWNARELRHLVTHRRLVDAWTILHDSLYSATWSRAGSSSRLDRFYVPSSLRAHIVGCTVVPPNQHGMHVSDHNAVLLSLDFAHLVAAQVTRWRLDATLLYDDAVVAEARSRMAAYLVDLSPSPEAWEAFKNWARRLFQSLGKQRARRRSAMLKRLATKIRAVRRGAPLTPLMEEYLKSLEDRYRLVVHKPAGAGNIREDALAGPGVLRYLHDKRHSHGGQQPPSGFRRPSGAVTDDPDEIVCGFKDFFRSLYTRSSVARPDDANFFAGLPVLSDTEQSSLDAPLTIEELDTAAFRAARGTSPGPDGLPAEFYVTFWCVIRKFFFEVLLACLNGQPFPVSFGFGHIVVLPKNSGDLVDPENWRPISLLNCDYKLLPSILARRIQSVLPQIMHPSQTCCVPGRSMYDTLSGLRDVLHYAPSSAAHGCFLSLDQAKAFDRVDHSYLLAVLDAYQFPSSLVNIIRRLYNNHRSSVYMLHRLSEEFPVSRGVRQGCPLSPILFALSIDPLLWSIDTAANIHGLPLPMSGSWKVAAYADDVTVLLRDASSVAETVRVYEAYAAISGGALNHRKTKLMPFSDRTAYEHLPFPVTTSVKILGVIFDRNGPTSANWANAVQDLYSQCESAGAYSLSYRERAYLVRSVFCGRVWHLSHVLIAPHSVVSRIHTAILSFLWRKRRFRPIARVFLSLPSSRGGLGLPDIGLMNRGIALKTALRIILGEPSPTQALLVFFMGPLMRDIAPHFYDPSFPAVRTPRRFHACLHAYHRKLTELTPPVSPNLTCPSRMSLAVLLAEVRDSPTWAVRRQQMDTTAWRSSVCSWLPAPLHDILWSFAWGIHPTRDRLHTWNVTPTNICTYCDSIETNRHVLLQCRVARIFWQLVRQSTNVVCPVPLDRRHRSHRISILVTACGAQILWSQRCRAVAQRRRNTPIFPLVRSLRLLVTSVLQRDLFALGEGDFLRRWPHHPSVSVVGGFITIAGVPP